MQGYTNLADFQARFNQTAYDLGLNVNYMSVWAPFTRRDTTSMTYVSIYNSTALMDTAMWAPNYPSSGDIYKFGKSSVWNSVCSAKSTVVFGIQYVQKKVQ